MVTNICLLLEAVSVVYCLHCLYGEKFKLDIFTTSFLAIDMIIMATINYYGLPNAFTMVIYPIIVLYCGIRFGFKMKALIINNILYMAIIGGTQLIVSLLFGYIFYRTQVFDSIKLLTVNCVTLVVIILILPKVRVSNLSEYLQDKERIYLVSLIISIFIMMFCMISYKKIDLIELYQSILLFSSIAFICILTSQLAKYKLKSTAIETELKMHKLYSDTFDNLIDEIRLKQHEFNDHISTIYSQHYTFKTYDALVKEQKAYCQAVLKENRHNKLLKAGSNPIIIGFLYGKFVEIDKLGIALSYKVSINDLNIGVPVYKIVEILGNLIKNAVEALESAEGEKKLFVMMIEEKGAFMLEVRNTSAYINYDELGAFFKKGYSKKGKNRGMGLYHVKNICNECSLNIYCDNKKLDDENWLSLVVDNKKETIKK